MFLLLEKLFVLVPKEGKNYQDRLKLVHRVRLFESLELNSVNRFESPFRVRVVSNLLVSIAFLIFQVDLTDAYTRAE